MAGYTIASLSIPNLPSLYATAKVANSLTGAIDLDDIFAVASQDMTLFPGINRVATPQDYLVRWVKNYLDAMNNIPSRRTASPKSACTDPAIRVIVKATQGLTDAAALEGEKSHNLFMSAENIQGNLLEEYIAKKVRPYGFLWCAGNVLHAIDFCNTTGTMLIQIKNKSNTENSSSSAIRTGTSIEKWYRLGTRTSGGVKVPDYKWAVLNALINNNKTQGHALPPCAMSEDDYQWMLDNMIGDDTGDNISKDNLYLNDVLSTDIFSAEFNFIGDNADRLNPEMYIKFKLAEHVSYLLRNGKPHSKNDIYKDLPDTESADKFFDLNEDTSDVRSNAMDAIKKLQKK